MFVNVVVCTFVSSMAELTESILFTEFALVDTPL